MQDLGAGPHGRSVNGVDVGGRVDRERQVVEPRRVQLELLLLERLPQAERPGAGSRKAEVVDLLAALPGDEEGSCKPSGPSTAR